MPLDDYTAVSGGGALRLKGAKVDKNKKKKKKRDKRLEVALERSSAASGEDDGVRDGSAKDKVDSKRRKASGSGDEGSAHESDNDEGTSFKTEAQRRFEEAKRKKFLELSKTASSNPELLKTHKERVEELNHFLSKLSEHNDMPKIGPG
ncbi:Uncharacterized protein C31G5.21 [Ceratocystis fimbriata CBS 114723]|uniref:Uncharacterized protein C31G5.21 n=1 Tax=Ceratocystis fimbriata CBS 114723 TaxID=1035309 RepID=A0A2C5X7G2_9PEZI|nr:Uncharacterized protein C31G5.21 [Ceratocystis fimbriata CBS 114723]